MGKPTLCQSSICLSSILFLLASCSASEASSVRPKTEERDQPQAVNSGEQAQDQANARNERAQLRVLTQWLRDGTDECGDDAMKLVVLEGERVMDVRDYCSAYALGGARAVTDARDRHYILLEHFEGRGTRATSGFLTIYEFDRFLDERARLLMSEPVGREALSVFHYRLETPPNGGIIIKGPWTVDGEMRGWGNPPSRSRTLLEIDTER